MAIGSNVNYAPFMRINVASTLPEAHMSSSAIGNYAAVTVANKLIKHKYVGGFANSNSFLFVDGIGKQVSTGATLTSEISTIYIGSHNGQTQLNGTIGNVKIYQSALSDAIIQSGLV
jgi:hypothetical protein